MGGRHSKKSKMTGSKADSNVSCGGKKYLTTNGTKCNDDTLAPKDSLESAPGFTDDQKKLVAESWVYIEADMNRVGVVMFMK